MIKKISGLFSLILIMGLASCSSDSSNSSNTPSGTITATIDGQDWRSINGAAVANLSTVNIDGETQTVLMITGMKADQSTIGIQFPVDNLTEGTYHFNADEYVGLLSYSNAAMDMYSSDEPGGSFTITITDIDINSGRLSGTFSGTLKDFDGNSMTMTEGRINSVMIMNNDMHTNGTMSLSKNGGAVFTMDNSMEDSKYLMIMESSAANNVSIFGYNATDTADFGIYSITIPVTASPGTYNLMTASGFDAGIGNSDTEPEYNLTSGTLTITSHSGTNLIGTFSFTASNGVTTVTITNGSFNVNHN
ncbi:hypothetical protein [Flavobacterium pedocola]